MNPTSNTNDVVYLIRAGRQLRDPLREQQVMISPPNPPSLLPPIFARKPYIVPYGKFAAPIDMDGKPLRARIAATREDVVLYPELRLEGVAEGGGGDKLASALVNAYDRQLPELRDRIDGIFRSHVGMRPEVEELERIWSPKASEDARDIARRIRADLGLDVDWTLEPEPAISHWVHSLMKSTPASDTLTFNAELPSTEFSLTFSITIERVDLSVLHMAQRRATAGLTLQQEIERLFKRVHEITNPAFRSVWTGINSWNAGIVRELAIDGFGTVVARRLQNEFGYKVRFSDFTPQPNAAMITAFRETSDPAILQAGLRAARNLVDALQNRRAQALLANDGVFDAKEVTDLNQSLTQAKSELIEAEREYLRGNQRQTERLAEISEGASTDLRKKFQEALRLEDTAETESKYAGGRKT